ncbi:stress-responsive transcription factor hsf1 [Lobulomyces angularis]|nr:stress-responsive transcription factor hsf1 [Lobulomyces angularis]
MNLEPSINQHLPTTVTLFVSKLYGLLSNPEFSDFLEWNQDGDVFHIFNTDLFASNVLPKFFSTQNFASFQRQLNIYGFKVVANVKKSQHVKNREAGVFFHPKFLRGRKDLLPEIRRKVTVKKKPSQIKTKLVNNTNSYNSPTVPNSSNSFNSPTVVSNPNSLSVLNNSVNMDLLSPITHQVQIRNQNYTPSVNGDFENHHLNTPNAIQNQNLYTQHSNLLMPLPKKNNYNTVISQQNILRNEFQLNNNPMHNDQINDNFFSSNNQTQASSIPYVSSGISFNHQTYGSPPASPMVSSPDVVGYVKNLNMQQQSPANVTTPPLSGSYDSHRRSNPIPIGPISSSYNENKRSAPYNRRRSSYLSTVVGSPIFNLSPDPSSMDLNVSSSYPIQHNDNYREEFLNYFDILNNNQHQNHNNNHLQQQQQSLQQPFDLKNHHQSFSFNEACNDMYNKFNVNHPNQQQQSNYRFSQQVSPPTNNNSEQQILTMFGKESFDTFLIFINFSFETNERPTLQKRLNTIPNSSVDEINKNSLEKSGDDNSFWKHFKKRKKKVYKYGNILNFNFGPDDGLAGN